MLQTLQLWKKYFQDLYKSTKEDEQSVTKEAHWNEIEIEPPTREVINIIKSLKYKKSPEKTVITVEMIKAGKRLLQDRRYTHKESFGGREDARGFNQTGICRI